MKLKKIIATVVAVASFASMSVVSFASGVNSADNFYTFETKVYNTNGSDTINAGDNITVDCYIIAQDGEEITVGKANASIATFAFTMPASVVDLVNADDSWYDDKGNSVSTPSGQYETVSVSIDGDVCKIAVEDIPKKKSFTIAPDEPIFTLTINTKSDAPAGSYAATVFNGGCSLFDDSGDVSLATSMNVKAVSGSFAIAGEEPVVPAGPSADKAEGTAYDTYTFENLEEGSKLAGKKVLMQKETAPVSGITADTRFIVSDGTRTQIFGGDIWDKLNAEGEGAVKAVNVIFGLIVDATNNNPFTFEVK